jgi:hypothetical protein
MSWNIAVRQVPKSSAAATINAWTAANCLGDPADDPHFAAHLSAAQASAAASLAGLTGAATTVDISIICVPDTGPASSATADTGCTIGVSVAERY